MNEIISYTTTTIAALCLGMMPLYIGMIRKLPIATVISSLFIVSIAVNSQAAGGGMITIIPISITMGAIGVIFASIAIRKIIVSDLD